MSVARCYRDLSDKNKKIRYLLYEGTYFGKIDKIFNVMQTSIVVATKHESLVFHSKLTNSNRFDLLEFQYLILIVYARP